MDKRKRIEYLDYLKGFAVFTMFLQHAMILYEKSKGNDTVLGNIFVLLGTAPAAPVFMVIMGIFIAKSRDSVKSQIKRGLKLFLLGYLLNLLRFTIPLLIAGEGGYDSTTDGTPVTLFLSVDIFQLSGLSIIILTILNKYIKRKSYYLYILISILFISPYLWGIGDNNYLLSIMWGKNANIYFPLLPWIIYPLIGVCGSDKIIGLSDNSVLQKRFLKIGIVLIVISSILLGIGVLDFGDYYRSGIGTHSLIIGVLLVWFSSIANLSNRLNNNNNIMKLLKYWSRNVTMIYFIQWVIFGWGLLVFSSNKLLDYQAAIISFCVLFITHMITKLVIILQNRN